MSGTRGREGNVFAVAHFPFTVRIGSTIYKVDEFLFSFLERLSLLQRRGKLK